ncbi:hypothetical protein BZG02_03055 [Labilibaculum filiforme]|uniref:Cupin n=1 Tax=Labilibaculum filiforme TaxID=1940526 RepID=A0A2N3I3G0_9BACT|nr:hypothetical protein [Labilibaculum filiforme]PKQ64845.1 hypothetical protein BZG02_03055 [Labilibaculum filiforme]
MSLIEKFEVKEEGYHPFLIREGWQVAQLNADENQKIENITRLDVHFHTDEVFLLLKGEVVLITASIQDNKPKYELELMQAGVTYNIPKNTWHNIAMQEGSEVIIIEKSNTHLADFEFHNLSENELVELRSKVSEIYTENLQN